MRYRSTLNLNNLIQLRYKPGYMFWDIYIDFSLLTNCLRIKVLYLYRICFGPEIFKILLELSKSFVVWLVLH